MLRRSPSALALLLLTPAISPNPPPIWSPLRTSRRRTGLSGCSNGKDARTLSRSRLERALQFADIEGQDAGEAAAMAELEALASEPTQSMT